ncbi:hypothetical protein D9M71_562850 [compost metagenome]
MLQLAQLQRFGLLFRLRVEGADAFQHLAHQGTLGRIRKALSDVPLRERGQTQLQRIGGQRAGMVDQVAHDGVAGRGQETAPAHFEMLDRLLVAASGVGPGAGL